MRSEHHPPEVLLREGDLLIMGGRDGNSVGHFSPRISATFVQLRSHACSHAPALRTCRSGCEAAVLGNRVYLVGGFDFDVLSSVDALSLTPRHAALCAEAPASGPHVDAGDAGVADAGSPTLLLTPAATWTPMPRLKKGRTRFGMCTLHGMLWVFGGADAEGEVISSVEVFHPESKTWLQGAEPMPTPRQGCGVAVLDGLIFVIGGTDAEGIPLSLVEVYDPVSGLWEEGQSMQQPRERFGVAVMDGCIFVAGGFSDDGRPVDSVEVFDSSLPNVLERWSPAVGLSSPRADLRLLITHAAANAGTLLAERDPTVTAGTPMVLAVGGLDDNGNVVQHVECLVQGRDAWQHYLIPERGPNPLDANTSAANARVDAEHDDEAKEVDDVVGSELEGEGQADELREFVAREKLEVRGRAGGPGRERREGPPFALTSFACVSLSWAGEVVAADGEGGVGAVTRLAANATKVLQEYQRALNASSKGGAEGNPGRVRPDQKPEDPLGEGEVEEGEAGGKAAGAEWEAMARVLDETGGGGRSKKRRLTEEEDDMPELDLSADENLVRGRAWSRASGVRACALKACSLYIYIYNYIHTSVYLR